MEPLVAAAARVVEYCSRRHDKEFAVRAGQDLEEAKALCRYMTAWEDEFWPYAEGTLCTFLGVLYLSRRMLDGEQEKQACLRTLAWPQAELHLQCLLGFGSLLASCDFKDYADDMDVRGPLEDLWKNYCSEMHVQVHSEERERPPTDLDGWPVKPYRATQTKLYFSRESKKPKPRRVSVSNGGTVPRLFDLTDMIMESDYSQLVPADKQGWNVRAWRNNHGDACFTLLDAVDDAYSPLNETRACFVLKPPAEHDMLPLRVGEARLLLKGIRCNNLLRSLVVDKPPKSTLSHFLSIINCMQHSRLWLARVDLRVYYDHDLTYAQLCTRESIDAEKEVLANSFMLERGPSILENMLRQTTLSVLWGETGYVLNMRPEDYELAMAPTGSMLWKALKKLGHARVADAKYLLAQPPPLIDVVRVYVPLLGFETAAKRDYLYAEGTPQAEELAEYARSTVEVIRMLSTRDPFNPVCGVDKNEETNESVFRLTVPTCYRS